MARRKERSPWNPWDGYHFSIKKGKVVPEDKELGFLFNTENDIDYEPSRIASEGESIGLATNPFVPQLDDPTERVSAIMEQTSRREEIKAAKIAMRKAEGHLSSLHSRREVGDDGTHTLVRDQAQEVDK